MVVVPSMDEFETTNEDFEEVFMWHALLKCIVGWMVMAIGCHGVKAIKKRTPRFTRKLMRRACCLAVMVVILTFVSIIIFADMKEEGGPRREWDDKVYVDNNDIYYYGDDEQPTPYGSITYGDDKEATIKITISWNDPQSENMDWNQFFYDLFERGDDLNIPQDRDYKITIVDQDGNVY